MSTRSTGNVLVRATQGRRLAAVLAVMPGQVRTLTLASFVTSVGFGLFLTGSSVYFVRRVGFSAVQVGCGLSAAGLLGLAGGVVAGFLADRFGASSVTVALKGLMIPLLVILPQVRSFWAFLGVTGVLGILTTGSDVSRSAWVAGLVDRKDLTRLSAYGHSAYNAGFSLGLLGAGAAIAVNTGPAYLCLFAGNAAATVVTCLMLLRLPRVHGTVPDRGTGPRQSAFRDLPYMLVAQVSGFTRLGDTILTVGLPLWIITRTAAPRELAAWLLVINTVVVVVFQNRASKRASAPAGAALIQQWAFAVLALTCLAISCSAGLAAGLVTVMLIAATLTITMGEMWGEGAWWTLRYGLAPSDAQGQYGGAFMLGQAIPAGAGPLLVTSLTALAGPLGWLVLAVLFVCCACVNRKSVAWAERSARHRFQPC